MGDAAGIGPEVIVAAWSRPEVHATVRPMVVGHPEIMRRAAKLLGSKADVVEFDIGSAAAGAMVLPTRTRSPACERATTPCSACRPGAVDARTGQAAYQCVCVTTEMVLHGKADAMVTAPLSKAALHAAAHFYPGHTELLADLCGVHDFAMMLYLPPGSCGPRSGRFGRGACDAASIDAECVSRHHARRRSS